MSPGISVIDPVGKAFDWMMRVLFRPFDLAKWFTIGFCAWLAFLGETGGGFNFSGGGGGGRGGDGGGGNLQREAEVVWDWIVTNLYWIIPVVVGVLLFIVVLGLVLAWLSSRGKFMFLYCVATDRAEVVLPWRRYAREGDNLFWLRVLLWLVAFVTILALLGIGLVSVGGMLLNGQTDVLRMVLAVGAFCLFALAALFFVLVGMFVNDFLTPIMYLRQTGWREAGGELLQLVGRHLGAFVLYVLFRIVLNLGIGILTILVVLATCCIAGCILAIPYLGTVLLLPVLVFKRAYSLYFLAQFGPGYDVFQPGVEAPVA